MAKTSSATWGSFSPQAPRIDITQNGAALRRTWPLWFASLNKSSGGLKWHTRFQCHTFGGIVLRAVRRFLPLP
jgi:hypothetical protein